MVSISTMEIHTFKVTKAKLAYSYIITDKVTYIETPFLNIYIYIYQELSRAEKLRQRAINGISFSQGGSMVNHTNGREGD